MECLVDKESLIDLKFFIRSVVGPEPLVGADKPVPRPGATAPAITDGEMRVVSAVRVQQHLVFFFFWIRMLIIAFFFCSGPAETIIWFWRAVGTAHRTATKWWYALASLKAPSGS